MALPVTGRYLRLALAAAFLAGVPSGVSSDASRARPLAAAEKPPCCFTNPSYSGVCQVKPAEDETCSSILSYLNTALSSGKSYCSNTDVRGGWQEVSCEKPRSASGR